MLCADSLQAHGVCGPCRLNSDETLTDSVTRLEKELGSISRVHGERTQCLGGLLEEIHALYSTLGIEIERCDGTAECFREARASGEGVVINNIHYRCTLHVMKFSKV